MSSHTYRRSILVVRLSHVADVVLASPVAPLIKRHTTNGNLVWVVQAKYASLLRDHPDIDELISWNKDLWLDLLRKGRFVSLLREIMVFRRQLRAHRIDIALDLQGVFMSSFLTWLSGAPIRIGLGSSHGAHWLVTKTISRNVGEETQLGSEYRYLLSQLGMPDSPWQMYIAKPKLRTADLEEKLGFAYSCENYAVLCPFSVFAQKRWPDDYWQQIALRIRGRYQLKTVLLGLDRDQEASERIAASTGAINLVGRTTLNEAAEIIRNARLLVGVDTGLTHMGHAFRTPTVGLFGSTCPYSYAGVETSKIIYQQRYCSPCNNKPICNGRFDCMQEITPDTVLSEIKPLMKIASELENGENF